jgi:hypothetical protein
MKHGKDVVERPMDNIIAIKKMSSYLATNANVFSPKKNIFIVRLQYHLFLDVNGLLFIVMHLKSDE